MDNRGDGISCLSTTFSCTRKQVCNAFKNNRLSISQRLFCISQVGSVGKDWKQVTTTEKDTDPFPFLLKSLFPKRGIKAPIDLIQQTSQIGSGQKPQTKLLQCHHGKVETHFFKSLFYCVLSLSSSLYVCVCCMVSLSLSTVSHFPLEPQFLEDKHIKKFNDTILQIISHYSIAYCIQHRAISEHSSLYCISKYYTLEVVESGPARLHQR